MENRAEELVTLSTFRSIRSLLDNNFYLKKERKKKKEHTFFRK